MVQVYIADFAKLPDPKDRKEIMAGLNADRRLRIAKAVNEKARRQCAGAGLLLNYVLTNHGVNPESVRKNAYGKPEVEGLYFNLTHSGDLAACAVSDKPVGCDIEKLREAPRKVASRYFGPSEKEYLAQYEHGAYDNEFFRLWTMKESYVKMTGEGMSLPFSRFEIVDGDAVSVVREGAMQECHVKEYEVPGYQFTVCAMENEFDELIWLTI